MPPGNHLLEPAGSEANCLFDNELATVGAWIQFPKTAHPAQSVDFVEQCGHFRLIRAGGRRQEVKRGLSHLEIACRLRKPRLDVLPDGFSSLSGF